MFDDERSELLVLNGTAAAIWYLVDGARSLAEIAAFIRAELPDAPADTEAAVRAFVDDMLARGALEIVNAD